MKRKKNRILVLKKLIKGLKVKMKTNKIFS